MKTEVKTEVEIDEIQKKKRKRALFTVKVMPWFMGLSNDLMFYITINTLFLTTVKHITASQISSFITASCLSYILLQRPFLKITKKIGNAMAVRIGTIILLLASIIITFAQSYYVMMCGQVLYTIAFLFKSMDNVMLKNNLTYLDKKDEYIKYKNKASIVYSSVTAVIALFAGHLFNINYYLPMYLCMAVCLINVLVSFKLTDESVETNERETINKDKKKVNFTATILILMISYAIFYATISTGQTNVKLFMQYELEKYFEIGIVATYLSYILLISRVARVLSNLSFYKIYNKLKDKIVYYIAILCALAFFAVITGRFIPQLQIKVALMVIGFCLILAIRDIFSTYMQDLLLKNTKKEEQQTGISYLGLSRKIGESAISFIFSLMLLKVDLLYIIVSLVVLALISYMINFKLYKMVRSN